MESGRSTTALRHVDEPAISLTGPGVTTPAPNAQAWLSAPPRTTGVDGGSPRGRATDGRSEPTTSDDRHTRGNSVGGSARSPTTSVAHARVVRSNASVA